MAGHDIRTEILHPSVTPTDWTVVAETDGLRVSLPRTPAALLIRCSQPGPASEA
ncbi:hypothetical protein [Streptomyces sp. NPDC000851]